MTQRGPVVLRLVAVLLPALAACGRAAPPPHPTDPAEATWYAGGATCDGPPAFRVREYRPGFFILRQPACTNYEKPFLYLLVGRTRALLLDTGAGGIAVAEPVDSVLGAWRVARGARRTAASRAPSSSRTATGTATTWRATRSSVGAPGSR